MRNYPECLPPLIRAGMTENDAFTLRRIAMQLHRWHELECGIASGGVERDEETGKCFWYSSYTGKRTPVGDRETGAKRRLAELLAKYPTLGYYIQGDPRGAAIYILRQGDIPSGADVDSCYSRGLAVYR